MRIAKEAPPAAAALAMTERCAGLDAANMALAPEAFNDRTQPVDDWET